MSTNTAGPDAHLVNRERHDRIWEAIRPEVRKVFRESTDNIDVAVYIRSCMEQKMTPLEGLIALHQHDVRRQWRYELAAFHGFPDGWRHWPLPTEQPKFPKVR